MCIFCYRVFNKELGVGVLFYTRSRLDLRRGCGRELDFGWIKITDSRSRLRWYLFKGGVW